MSLDQHAPTTVVLAASAPELPNFGVSVIPLGLNSQQTSKFLALSGGLSTIRVVPSSFDETLEAIGLTTADIGWIDVADHFGGDRVPDEAYVTYRGTPDQAHIQTITVNPDAGSDTQARVGEYRITDIEGGPYIYNSLGATQVTDLEITDAGGGNGATGRYTVSDNAGNAYVYESGGTNVWTFQITAAATGLYSVTAEGEVYSYTAGGSDTINDIRDAILADMNNLIAHPGGHPEWISNAVSTDTITLTAADVGFQLTVSSNLGPTAAEATLTETTPLVPETVGAIATAIDDIITGISPPPPVEWTTSVAAGIITCTAQPAFVGVDLGIKIAGPTASDATTTITTDHRETTAAIATALDGLMTAVSHPSFSNGVASNVITLTGITAGVAILVNVASPADSMVLQETQSTLTLRSSQVQRVTIIPETGSDAYLGGYTLSLLGENLQHTATAGATVTTVRDALQANVDANLATETSTVAVGSDAFDITITEAGLPVTVTITSPGNNSGASTNIQTASYGVVDDFDRALADEPQWYFWLDRGTDTDIEALTVYIDQIAPSTPRRYFTQVSDQAIPDTPSATADDVGQFVKDTGTLRTTVLWDPVPSSPTQDQQGMVHQWVGDGSTSLPGSVQWQLLRLGGVSGGQKLSGTQETNMRDKAVAWVERIDNIGPDGARAVNGPYTASGRQQDIARAMDQIKAVYQIGAVALLVNKRIIPYTNPGMAEINDFIVSTTLSLETQGLVIPRTFRYLTPDGQMPTIDDATDAETVAGIFPEFKFQITIQVGGVAIPMFIEVTQ